MRLYREEDEGEAVGLGWHPLMRLYILGKWLMARERTVRYCTCIGMRVRASERTGGWK